MRIGRLWLRGQGVTERIYVRPGDDDDPDYLNSPFYEAAQTRRWVELWLPSTDDSAFGIVPELKADGLHPLPLRADPPDERRQRLGDLRDAPAAGFSERGPRRHGAPHPAVAILIDVRSTWLALHQLLRTYVGDEPHQAILRGNTKRGQVSTIKSAMLFADMRDSVGHTADLERQRGGRGVQRACSTAWCPRSRAGAARC